MVIIVYKYLKYYWVTKVYKAISPNLILIFGFFCAFLTISLAMDYNCFVSGNSNSKFQKQTTLGSNIAAADSNWRATPTNENPPKPWFRPISAEAANVFHDRLIRLVIAYIVHGTLEGTTLET